MAHSPKIFDLDERYVALSATGDPLERLSCVIDFEVFRPALDAALKRSESTRGGHPPMDTVMIYKVLVMQSLYGLADEQTGFQSWSYDFVHCRTDDGRAFRTLNIIDECNRECLAIRTRQKLNFVDVIDALTDLFILRGVPAYIRSDNGPEFVAEAVRKWIAAAGAKTACIEPGSPWENGYVESFNARFRDALLNGEIFYALKEAQIIIEQWRKHHNTKRPYGALGYRPPAPEVTCCPCGRLRS